MCSRILCVVRVVLSKEEGEEYTRMAKVKAMNE